MAVDYNSTLAWNNPYNPWPRFTSVTLSGNYIDDNGDPFSVNTTLTLSAFTPTGAGNLVIYVNQDFSFNMIYSDSNEWLISRVDNYAQFVNQTTLRATPGGGILSAIGFIDNTGIGAGTLSLTINKGYTQWEKRRKRLLGYK